MDFLNQLLHRPDRTIVDRQNAIAILNSSDLRGAAWPDVNHLHAGCAILNGLQDDTQAGMLSEMLQPALDRWLGRRAELLLRGRAILLLGVLLLAKLLSGRAVLRLGKLLPWSPKLLLSRSAKLLLSLGTKWLLSLGTKWLLSLGAKLLLSGWAEVLRRSSWSRIELPVLGIRAKLIRSALLIQSTLLMRGNLLIRSTLGTAALGLDFGCAIIPRGLHGDAVAGLQVTQIGRPAIDGDPGIIIGPQLLTLAVIELNRQSVLTHINNLALALIGIPVTVIAVVVGGAE